MNKTVQILFLTFCCVSASTNWGGSFGNYGGYGGLIKGHSCQDAIGKINGAFEQLVEDVTSLIGPVNEWVVYSDVDTVDDVSFYLGRACDVKQLDVVTKGSQACKDLGQLLEGVVQQAGKAFKVNYHQSAQLTEQALTLGQGVEKGCQVRVVKKQPVPQQANNEEEALEEGTQQDNFIGFASTWGTWGEKYASQYASQYSGGKKQQKGDQDFSQYGKQYQSKYGGKYSSEGKDMTKLGNPGQGAKYGTDQAELSHKINKENTEKYGKKNKYQEKYQKNNEEEDNIENGEGLNFNLDDFMVWM